MNKFCFLAIASTVGVAASAFAGSPAINSAVITGRIFNDYPGSNFSSVNAYPAHINLSDGNMLGPPAFANRHNWRLSEDSGVSSAHFANGDPFSISADVTISTTGTGAAEGGLQVSPWWSPDVDGSFNLRTTDGEIAVFGGRLPFFSFTAAFGAHYVAGTTVNVGIDYQPQGLNPGSPGLARYWYRSAATGLLESNWIAFDEGNPGEAIPHGLWGVLNDARVGGYLQVFGQQTGAGSVSANFDNIVYSPVPAPASAAVLALGGLFAARRRR